MTPRFVLAVTTALLIAMPVSGPVDAVAGSRATARTLIDDPDLTRSGRWKDRSSGDAIGTTLSKSRDRGATLTGPATTSGGRAFVQAGPGRGRLVVIVGGVKQKKVDTDADRKHMRKVRFQGAGEVVLKVKKPGRGVYVDAIIITPVPPPPPPILGQGVIFTEVLLDPGGIGQDNGEWLELHNTNPTEPVSVAGCTITYLTQTATLPNSLVAPGDDFVVARNADPAVNGGVVADATIGFNFGSNLTFACGGTTYDAIPAMSNVETQSRSLDPDFYSAGGNDLEGNWCNATTPYGTAGLFGTPGAMNPQC